MNSFHKLVAKLLYLLLWQLTLLVNVCFFLLCEKVGAISPYYAVLWVVSAIVLFSGTRAYLRFNDSDPKKSE